MLANESPELSGHGGLRPEPTVDDQVSRAAHRPRSAHSFSDTAGYWCTYMRLLANLNEIRVVT